MTDRQRRFADEYLISLNATDAAIMAGYSENRAASTGYELLNRNDEVHEYVYSRLEKEHEGKVATLDEVLEFLTKGMRNQLDEEIIVIEQRGLNISKAERMRKEIDLNNRIKCAKLIGARYGAFVTKIDANVVTPTFTDDVQD